MAALNAKSYELLSASSVFLRAPLLPVYTTCIFRCRFTSVKKENKHTHTHTRTATPLCGYAYALCQTKIVQQGRGEVTKCSACSAIWNATIIRSVVRRGMLDVRNAQVPLQWSRVHLLLLLLLLLHHLLSLTFFPPPSPLTTPFTLVFSLLCANFELHKEEGVGSAIYRTYTNIYDWFHMSSAADSSLSGCEVFWQ